MNYARCKDVDWGVINNGATVLGHFLTSCKDTCSLP